MEERARFVLEALEGWSSMSALCEKYGVSRRVGYKWLERYQGGGLAALADRKRAPRRQAQETAPEVVAQIVALRRQRPSWGPRKLRARLQHLEPERSWPAASTIGEILRREGLVERRRKRAGRLGAWRSEHTEADAPNRVWTADFKGEFRLGCGRLCYPLTIVDAHSRFLLGCRALPSTATRGARATFERVFSDYGLPEVIRTDNGTPFRSNAVAGLSQLAVWWIRLGIRLEWTRPRHPQDNGAHERMHRTLKAEAIRPARSSPELQQRAFNRFRRVYNEERPHESLEHQTPAALYRAAERRLPPRLPEVHYPEHFFCRKISKQGQFRWRKRGYYVSETLHHQTLGLEHTHDGCFNLYFGPVLLGEFNEQQQVVKLAQEKRRSHPRPSKVLPM
jgi:transposase InsO family protein